LEQIRIVLAGMPRMLREIVREIVQRELDMTVVAETADQAELVRLLGGRQAEVVLAGTEGLRGADVDRLFDRHPRLKLLAVSGVGSEAVLYELRPRKVALGELAPGTLTAAIRDVCAARSLGFDDV
jgi:DNA-binding NarL/FixJ family response regulator